MFARLSRTAFVALAFFVTSTFALAPVEAQSSDYRPVQFDDPSLATRADLAKTYSELRVRTTRATQGRIATLANEGVALSFFEEIALLLKATDAADFSRNAQPMPSSLCSRHRAFDSARIPSVRGVQRCDAARKALEGAVEGSKSMCREISEPETVVERQEPGKVSFWQLRDIEGLILTIGEPLRHIEFPEALITDAFRSRMRSIIAKLRHDDMQRAVAKRLRRHDELLNLMAAQPDCFEGSVASFTQEFSALKSELETARGWLTRLDEAGREQAQRDHQAVLARGRFRQALPFPSLTDEDRQLLSLFLGGLYWRARGGGILDEPKGTQLTRVYFTLIPMGVLGWINGGDEGRQVGEGMFIEIFAGWGKWMDMGRTPNQNDRFHDLVHMTERGSRQVRTSVGTLGRLGYDTSDLRMGGMQMGPCYDFSWSRFSQKSIGADRTLPYQKFLEGPTAWGELCTGAAISLGLSKSLLGGYTLNGRMPFFTGN